MRVVLLASTVLGLAAAAPALAHDDMRSPDAALADAAVWTGAYVGLQMGLGASGSDFDVNPPPIFDTDIGTPFIHGGLYLGYAKQLGNLILGVEGDISGMSLDEGVDPFFGGKSFDYSEEWLSTLRGRIGVGNSNFSLYATGGLAAGEVDASYGSATVVAAPPPDFFALISDNASSSDVKIGWTAGAGAGIALDEHWRAKVEYLYVDLEDTEFTLPVLGDQVSVENTLHIGRIGLGYQF